jgi:hypothetical protein
MDSAYRVGGPDDTWGNTMAKKVPTTATPDYASAGKPGDPPLVSVSQYIADLHSAPSPDRVFVGMVKPSEDGDTNALSFAYMGDCSNWIKITDSAIAAIDHLPDVICQGVSYKAARITMNAPQPGEAQAFANLANLHRAKLSTTQIAFTQAASSLSSAGDGCPDGYTRMVDRYGQVRCVKDTDL